MGTYWLSAMTAFVLTAGALAIGCGGDDGSTPTTPDGGTTIDGGGGDAGGPLELTAFARQLIETETKENNRPAATEDKAFVDSMDPNAFPPSFFP
ncbi:hypothetical protein [Pendulispora albinea]|uniref:Uncharacterized protein n=1 Tax=Pendulispora albinea TaxID=2741071 RepID=A0ABZ2M5M3_9BACT